MDSNTPQNNSRPKIHRLPQQVVPDSTLYISRVVLMVCFALLMIAVVPRLLEMNKAEPEKIHVNVEPAQPAGLEVISIEPESNRIVRDENGEVVGQLTQMPTDDEQLTQVKTITNVDSTTGKELLGIIGKY